jgi:thiamine kinase-like enzyme
MERTAARLERLAERYVPGSGTARIDALGSGLTNRSYRVRRNGQLFSLRIAAPRARELGLDRGWECRVLRCAAGADLAPAVECCEPGAGVLVTRWAEGRSWTVEEASSPENIRKVALLARRVHALPPLDRPRSVSPGQWIAYYRRALHRRGGDKAFQGRQRALGGFEGIAQSLIEVLSEEPSASPALCHSDLHVENLLIASGGAPVILDWEYAHISDPWWDLAGWACNGDLTAERGELLLRDYLGREPTSAQGGRLRRLAWLYDYVCLLWSELYLSSRSDGGEAGKDPPRDAPGDAVRARAERLADRLRHDS